jgi:hypothetical protein
MYFFMKMTNINGVLLLFHIVLYHSTKIVSIVDSNEYQINKRKKEHIVVEKTDKQTDKTKKQKKMPSWKTYCIECPSSEKATELQEWIERKSQQDGYTPFMGIPDTTEEMLLLQQKMTQYVDCGKCENMVYAHTVFFPQQDNFLETIQPYWTRSAIVWFDGRTETATEVTLYQNEKKHQENGNDDDSNDPTTTTISVIEQYWGRSGYGGIDVVVKVYLDHSFRLRCYACTCPTDFPMTTIPGGPTIVQFDTREQLQKVLNRDPTSHEESLFGLLSSTTTTTTTTQ